LAFTLDQGERPRRRPAGCGLRAPVPSLKLAETDPTPAIAITPSAMQAMKT